MTKLAMTILALVILTLSYNEVLAQDSTGSKHVAFPTIGSRMRIHYDTTVTERFLYFIKYGVNKTQSLNGNLSYLSFDTLTIGDIGRDSLARSFHVSSINKIYVSTGKKRATLSGLKIAALMGLAIFYPHNPNQTSEVGRLTAYGGIVTLGGLIGWFTKKDRWERIPESAWPRPVANNLDSLLH